MYPILNLPIQEIEERVRYITCSEHLKQYAEKVLSVLDSKKVVKVNGESLQENSGNESNESENDFLTHLYQLKLKFQSPVICALKRQRMKVPTSNMLTHKRIILYSLAEGDSECLLH